MMHTRFRILLALALVLPAGLRAEVKPHALFTNGAVLQQGVKVPIWGTADPGEQVTIVPTATVGRDRGLGIKLDPVVADEAGHWIASLPEMKADNLVWTLEIRGKSNTVTVKDVVFGEVWVCSGQSNMEWALSATATGAEDSSKSTNPNIRLFKVPRLTAEHPVADINASWQPCTPETVASFTAVGYYFGRDLQAELGVPVGLIQSAWGGTPAEAWTSVETLQREPELRNLVYNPDAARQRHQQACQEYLNVLEQYLPTARQALEKGEQLPAPPNTPPAFNHSPHAGSTLFNGMIAPLIPYPIKGAIWYQGESNAGRAYQYRTLFPAMIEDWRFHWGSDFPFLLVQLAPFMKIEENPQESAWAELREAQLLATQTLDDVGMAVITDVGEENDIHPRRKEPVGARLALAARAIAYDQDIAYSGPIFTELSIEGGKAILSFDHIAEGLKVAGGGELTGFTIAAEDRKFVNAQAKIEGDQVVVWSDSVPQPVAVRYGWANYPVVNLANSAGLFASPFRTDDWAGVTGPKQGNE